MSELIAKLDRLSKAAPDVCETLDHLSFGHIVYSLGEYHIFIDDDGQPAVSCPANAWQYIKGQPAMDWLRGALERVIEARGLGCKVELWPLNKKSVAQIWHPHNPDFRFEAGYNDGEKLSPAAALLDALLAAVESLPDSPVAGYR